MSGRARHVLFAAVVALLFVSPATAGTPLTDQFDKAVQDAGGDFSGAVLVTRDGDIVFDKAYGMADIEARQPNLSTTSFHIGGLSRAFTATIVMMLVEKRRLWLDNTLDQMLPGTPGGDRVRIRDLLASDPASLAGRPAYNLLARVVEARTGEPFADTVNSDFFGPMWLKGSGIDTGDAGDEGRQAKGYVRDASGDLTPAPSPDWAALLGDASAYATTRDALRWLNAFFDDGFVSAASRQTMLDSGYGGFLADSRTFGEPLYRQASNGHGFSSFVACLPKHGVTVIVFGNVEGEGTERIGDRLTAIALQAP